MGVGIEGWEGTCENICRAFFLCVHPCQPYDRRKKGNPISASIE